MSGSQNDHRPCPHIIQGLRQEDFSKYSKKASHHNKTISMDANLRGIFTKIHRLIDAWKAEGTFSLFLKFFYYSFIPMCVHSLGHFSPLPLSPTFSSFPPYFQEHMFCSYL
jgi:hypothetical protein